MDEKYGIGLYSMEAWDKSIQNIRLVQNSEIREQDLHAGPNDPPTCDSGASSPVLLPGYLQCSWSS